MKKNRFRVKELIRESVIVRNPALVEAAGLFPLIATAVSVKASVIISACSFVLVIFTGLFASLFLKKLPRFVRVAIYFILNSGIIYVLCLFFADAAPNETAKLGVALPLLAASSFVALHCERYSVKQSAYDSFISSAFAAVGYCAVCMLVGSARELFGNGTLLGHPIGSIVTASGLLLPFGGLLALGLLAAAFKFLRIKLYPHYEESEISDIILSDTPKKEDAK